MSEFKCEVVQLGPVTKHPNADTLGIVHVWGYPVIVKLGEFKEGDLAVYIPIDAVVPTSDPMFAFLGRHSRIKAKKLRGVFSMGMLVPMGSWADGHLLKVGDDVAGILNIKKYEEPEPAVSHNGNMKTGGDCETVPFFYINYDVPNMRRYMPSLASGEEVVVTEKIHGCNSRFIYHNGRIWAGSHNTWKKPTEENMWWKLVKDYNIENLASQPDRIFYGEAYGWVQDLRYDHEQGKVSLRFFDIFDIKNGKWLDWDDMESIVKALGWETVPVLYKGAWDPTMVSMAEGSSVIGNNMREGIVVRPVKERFDQYCGRPVLKYVSEQYLLRKDGTERH